MTPACKIYRGVGVYKRGMGVAFDMESSGPIQLPKLFSEDYSHFESTHDKYPVDAAAVFGCVADLRVALQVFREATIGGGGGVSEVFDSLKLNDEGEGVLMAEPAVLEETASDDAAAPSVLLAAGSVEDDAQICIAAQVTGIVD